MDGYITIDGLLDEQIEDGELDEVLDIPGFTALEERDRTYRRYGGRFYDTEHV